MNSIELKYLKPLQSIENRIFALALSSFILLGTQVSTLNVAWFYIRQDFGKNFDDISALLLISMVGGILVNIYSGRILQHISIGKMCLLSIATNIVGLIIIRSTAHWIFFVAAFGLLGIANASLNVSINTFIASRYDVKHMNWLHATFGIGAFIGPLIATGFIVHHPAGNWRLIYSLLTIFQSMLGFAFLQTLSHWLLPSHSNNNDGENTVTHATLLNSLRQFNVWLGILFFLFHSGLQGSSGQLGYHFLVVERHIDASTAGLLMSMFWGCIALGRAVFGVISHYVETTRALHYAMLVAFIGTLLLLFPIAPIATAGFLLLGLGLAPAFPSGVSKTADLVGKRHSHNAIGLQMTGGLLGASLTPSAISYLSETAKEWQDIPFDISILVSSFILLALIQSGIYALIASKLNKN